MDTARIRNQMAAAEVDGIVASTLENVFYLSGIWSLGAELFRYDAEGYVVATPDRPEAGIWVSSIGEADLILDANPTIERVSLWGAFERAMPPDGVDSTLSPEEERVRAISLQRAPHRTSVDALAAALEEAGLAERAVAVDERGPNRGLIEALQARFPRMRITPASQLFRRIRMVKTADEITRMQETVRVTEHAFRATVAEFREGITERELVRIFDRAIVDEGGHPAFALIRLGRSMAVGQSLPTDAALRKGDYVWFDIGCRVSGYQSDIGRVVSFGEPSDRLRLVQGASRAGQDRAIELMRPGVLARDVFTGAVERVRESGIPHYQRHHVGHGIGIETYDLPILTPSTDIPLEPNMIFEVETPYYELGFGGAFIEDTVLVTDGEARILTTLDRDLIVVGA
ncbi:MAG: aminopeptidase P family protein [Chloroflexi bacterium]|nr:aminopeptidase P family protein [Chloroflexota bacterium]